MNAFSRRGACPTLSAPMQTGDGLLVRLNPVAGGLSPKSLIGLCESALKRGNGIMEVTARGSLQIRGLTAESAVLLAAEVDALGIAVRTGVPVETGPLAGIDPREIADPRSLAERVRAAVEEAGLTPRLGPKVSVVVDGGGQLTMDGVTADVRLKAVRVGAGIQWLVSVAGDGQNAKPLATVDADAARDIALAVLRMVAEKGREAHARDLSERQLASLASWHSVAPPSVLPDISPSRGEISRVAGGSPLSTLKIGEIAHEDAISPLEGEMSGRTEGGVRRPIGLFPLSNDTTALGIALPFGSMPAEKLIALAQSALSLGTAEIRLAPGRALLFLGQPSSANHPLRATAAALGFVTTAADPRTRIAACPGTPACASGQIATRDIAETIAAEMTDSLDFTLHISSCAKGCAHPGPAALTLVGGENGAGLVVNATAKALPAGYRPGYDAARGIVRVAAMVRSARYPGETAAACLTRLGPAAIAKAYRQTEQRK
ncbi:MULTISPECIES: precorrin-3B synthase [unclassified Mesorhizobium]|uniref:precorrin-3B synthase n=1 Tax=unclassified Mesorhizobium TaxID=325217 RepID=UPI0003CDD3B5|nr:MULTISPECIES: precorrin-3B synthase [unclassified Mesorhizobium]ESX16207.1 cobalamin biosynthesis protein CobG [Mesorhizobium sp. LSJC255A00]ESX29636.1 cobalamin biosynthesis protein CobG [Mesorhizobium sp. LSHC440B00]ESX35441.1 cobalamin biosynthesis protein CobG [Mesorhizobium sp. LSHC432A00]ESX41654.1 cobalamin biosynthesis protein CobG [Mesorhizobium sp. LSHC440A00]ESX75998.1 cobalamin biosynthesis protein CobG [Mesorhizobium sp. LSHC414A00]